MTEDPVFLPSKHEATMIPMDGCVLTTGMYVCQRKIRSSVRSSTRHMPIRTEFLHARLGSQHLIPLDDSPSILNQSVMSLVVTLGREEGQILLLSSLVSQPAEAEVMMLAGAPESLADRPTSDRQDGLKRSPFWRC